MIWKITLFPTPGQSDIDAQSIIQEAAAQGLPSHCTVTTASGFLIETEESVEQQQMMELAGKLLADSVAERVEVEQTANGKRQTAAEGEAVYVLPKPGVTDNDGTRVQKLLEKSGLAIRAVRSFKKYGIAHVTDSEKETLVTKLLANDSIEQVFYGNIPLQTLHVGAPYEFKLLTVPIRTMNEDELQRVSKEGQLSLSLPEMQTIQAAYIKLDRDPTDIELETFAQTWSEHCSHKTLAGRIHHVRKDSDGNILREWHFDNMLKETIFAATRKLCETNPRVRDFCVSVFADNAGVVTFDEEYNVTFKAETHNRPSAIEPYGGAHTGLGGCIRDTMGTGLGAKPIVSTSVSCFAPPCAADSSREGGATASNSAVCRLPSAASPLPQGVLHPRRIMNAVAAGVQDYGNRMDNPTVNGMVYFDKRYLGNPLVFCGNIGIIPKDKSAKAEPNPGDLVVALGARTGKDGIHGATFSSGELTHESETVAGGATQIGAPEIQKKVLDAMLQARDRHLYTAVTDCGAGGFSSAVGEMGEKIGVEVELSHAPLKYEGLSYTEIWISEAQERMVLAVPPENWDEFKKLCDSYEVEATILGTFKPTGRLVLKYQGQQVADLEMKLLHKGRPPVVREAVYVTDSRRQTTDSSREGDCTAQNLPSAVSSLRSLLSSLNSAGKHWFARRFGLEALADAAVVRPRPDSPRGLVISCGMKPQYGDIDPYRMAAASIDEAVRNAVCAGADPKTIALLDNFCWGNTERPETLGLLVEAALACYDVALAFEMPFISGKDSLNNEFRPAEGESIAIPPTLLISAMGQIDDVSKSVTMALKTPGNLLYQLGDIRRSACGANVPVVPELDVPLAKRLYETIHSAIMQGLLCSIHDLSTGGLAVAVAEMCIAGDLGATLTGTVDSVTLFSESNSRFVIEVAPESVSAVESLFKELPMYKLGEVTSEKVLMLGEEFSVSVEELKAAWQKTLDW